MTTLEEITIYAERCLNGEIISCRAHKWACMRLLDDLEKAKLPDYPFYWDEDKACNIVEWFALLRHSKGVLAGQPIILTD